MSKDVCENLTKGVIFFNRGPNMVVRALVSVYSLRKYYDGDITFYIEEPTPKELVECLKYFNVNIVENEKRHDLKTLVRKSSLLEDPPYDLTLWLDIDTVTVGSVDGMFNHLINNNADLCLTNFCNWLSTGSGISKRISGFKGIAEDEHIEESLKKHPAINTGILSFRKSKKWKQFMGDVTELARKGSEHGIFIPDECAMQILYPSISKWGLKCHISETDYNVSPLHDHGSTKSPKIYHFHGDKHVLDVEACEVWKKEFKEMIDGNIGNIRSLLKYSDKRLKKYLIDSNNLLNNGIRDDVTIVTACDEYYVDILRYTFTNWRKYKSLDKFPVIVFVNGIPIEDVRLDFLKIPNVTIIPWSMPDADSHREEMLSAFVFGTAQYVTTDYWLKLDADSFAVNDKPLFSEDMKKFAFCGHKWNYSRPDHIKLLDDWAKNHKQPKLKNAKPMLSEGKVEGNRFYHNKKRTISFIQLHKTKFTRFCVKLLGGKNKLPAPTQDTYMFFVCDRFDPQFVGTADFKRNHGFIQGNGKLGAEVINQRLKQIDEENMLAEANPNNVETNNVETNNVETNNEKILSLDNEENILKEEINIVCVIPFTDKNGNKCTVEV